MGETYRRQKEGMKRMRRVRHSRRPRSMMSEQMSLAAVVKWA